MISRIKTVCALSLLCAVPVWSQKTAQKTAPKVHTESRVPAVSIDYMRQEDKDFKFSIRNDSGHGVTAFAVLLVPSSVHEKNQHFACHGQCSAAYEVDDIDHPAVGDGSVIDVKYEAEKVSGGTVVLESAIFDDGSYAGNEKVAAYLVAQQLGNQEEFDRIVPAVYGIMNASDPQSISKADRIYAQLEALPVSTDPSITEAFLRWFPNLRDCERRFPEVIKKSASQEKSDVEAKLKPILSSGDTSDRAVERWWGTTMRSMAHLGCSACAERMASPAPPVTQTTVSIGCTSGGPEKPDGVWLTVELVDDSSADDDTSGDDADQTASTDADTSNAPDQAAMNPPNPEPADALTPVPAPPLVKVIPPASVSAPAPAPIPPVVQPQRILSAPTLIPVANPRYEVAEALPGVPPPLPDEAIYENYSYYVVAWSHYLSDGGTADAAARAGHSPYPFPPGTNSRDQKTVTRAAYHCVTALGDFMAQLRPYEVGSQSSLRPEDMWKPVSDHEQFQRELADKRVDQRAAVVRKELDQLKLQLGKSGFHDLDTHVHGLYQASPGRLVREPMPEWQMFVNYFRYIAWLSGSAGRTDMNREDTARERADEQKACGLDDDSESILQNVADDFLRTVRQRRSKLQRAKIDFGMYPATAAVRAVMLPAAEMKRIGEAHMEQLKSRLSKESAKKIDARVQALYGFLTIEKVLAVSDTEAKPKTNPQEVVKNQH